VQATGTGQLTFKGRGGTSGDVQAGVRIGYVGQGGGTVSSIPARSTSRARAAASSGQFYIAA